MSIAEVTLMYELEMIQYVDYELREQNPLRYVGFYFAPSGEKRYITVKNSKNEYIPIRFYTYEDFREYLPEKNLDGEPSPWFCEVVRA